MRRRECITVFGGAAILWPFVASNLDCPRHIPGLMLEFHQGLSETGYVEGKNDAIEYHWGITDYLGLKELAVDLVRRQVNVITVSFSLPQSIRRQSRLAEVFNGTLQKKLREEIEKAEQTDRLRSTTLHSIYGQDSEAQGPAAEISRGGVST